MLLKVSDGNSGWLLFDKVDSVHLLSEIYIANTTAELSAIGDEGVLNLVSKACFRNNEGVSVGIIEFTKQGTTHSALVTDVVFICNDSGDTLDKLNVRKRR